MQRMCNAVICTILLTLCVLATTSVVAAKPPQISYQIHSWNDIEEWRAAFRKGTNMLKVDVHYMNGTFCEQQRRIIGHDPRGCFVLSHDVPSPQWQTYHTPNDVFQFIVDPQNEHIFTRAEEKIYIAFCFKTAFNPCKNQKGAAWISLVEDMFNKFQSIVSRYNIEFILDGTGTAGRQRSCLSQRFRPWNYTWISIKDPKDALYSNDVSQGYDRFQYIDEPIVPLNPPYFLNRLRKVGYGKFANISTPIFIWEPHNQKPIIQVADAYLKGPLHYYGLRFAINIDPVMFQVFAAKRSEIGRNIDLVKGTAATNPQIVVIQMTDDITLRSNVSAVAFTFYHHKKNGEIMYKATVLNTVSGNISHFDDAPLPGSISFHADLVSVKLLTEQSSTIHRLLFTNSAGAYFVYDCQISIASGSSTVSVSWKLMEHGVFPVDDSVADQSQRLANSELTFWEALVANQSAAVIYSRPSIDTDDTQLCISTPIGFSSGAESAPLCLSIGSLFVESVNSKVQKDKQFKVFGAATSKPFVWKHTANNHLLFFSAQSNSSDDRPFIFMGHITRNSDDDDSNSSDSNLITVSNAVFKLTVRRKPIGVGRFPSVDVITNEKYAQYPGQLFVMQVYGDGYCYNSEKYNKRPLPSVCTSTPISIDQVLEYNFGTLDSFMSQFATEELITSCNSDILHGTFDRGSHPSVALFCDRFGAVGVLETHEGFRSSTFHISDKCGDAVAFDGIVMDSWPLPWDTMYL